MVFTRYIFGICQVYFRFIIPFLWNHRVTVHSYDAAVAFLAQHTHECINNFDNKRLLFLSPCGSDRLSFWMSCGVGSVAGQMLPTKSWANLNGKTWLDECLVYTRNIQMCRKPGIFLAKILWFFLYQSRSCLDQSYTRYIYEPESPTKTKLYEKINQSTMEL